MVTSTSIKSFFIFGRDFSKEKLKKDTAGSNYDSTFMESGKVFGSSFTHNDCCFEENKTILSSIDSGYFVQSSTYDFFIPEIKFIPYSKMDSAVINNRIVELSKQKSFVSRQISFLIQENHNRFMDEIYRLSNIQFYLEFACCNCQKSRILLNNALKGIQNGGLRILLYFKKKERLKSLLKKLSMIKTLHQAEICLNMRLNLGNYKEASHICMIFLKALSSFHSYFSCVDLSSKLEEIKRNLIDKLDESIGIICLKFDPTKFIDLLCAYNSLHIGEVAIDKIILIFINRLKSTSLENLVLYCNTYLQKNSVFLTGDPNIHIVYTYIQSHFVSDLSESYINTIISICCSFCYILFSYIDVSFQQQTVPDFVSSEYYISQDLLTCKLKQGKVLLWLESEKTIIFLLNIVTIERFNFHDFIHLVEIIKVYLGIGNLFCGHAVGTLQDCLFQMTFSYFRDFNILRIEELKFFLENESWEFCPLPGNFSLHDLQEFEFLTCLNTTDLEDSTQLISHDNFLEFDIQNFEDRLVMLKHLKLDFMSQLNCCKLFKSTLQDISLTSPSEGSELENHSRKHVSDDPSHVIIISNTTLISLRFIGRYIQLMHLLKPIAVDLFHFITEIYKFYFYIIYLYFAHSNSFNLQTSIFEFYGMESHDNYFSSKLKFVISNIEKELSLSEKDVITSNVYQNLLKNFELFGLRFRVIGVESLIFLSEQLCFLRPTLEALLDSNISQSNVDLPSFYTQFVQLSYGLRRPLYCGLARYLIDYEQIIQKMSILRWDFKELSSEHNLYIDSIVQEFEKLSRTVCKLSICIKIPQLAKNMIYEECSSLTNKLLVEGFSLAKKCNQHGRALMLLDFRQYVVEVERICQIKITHKGYVEDYIHAFYLEDEELDRWIFEHKDYSVSQLHILINCRISFTKRTTNKFLNLIEKGTPQH